MLGQLFCKSWTFRKVPSVSGEELHELGREGAERAKTWLDSTTRANAKWVNPEPFAVPKLTFRWNDEGDQKFSFDLGGDLIGGTLDKQEFLAECKYYKGPGDQGTLYYEYLAKCYRAYQSRPERCDNFMWITWAPFLSTHWEKLCSADWVRLGVEKHWEKLKPQSSDDPEPNLEDCEDVASRLWIIVLSQRQESLVVSREHRGVIEAYRITNGGS